ncbi:MAG: YfhO family protein [Acidobacteriota bacterium]|nr:YfhO family protein [Acidobacteriota bacterium]
MTALLLFLVVTIVTLLAWNRWVTPLSRGAAIVLILLPFLFTGRALLTNRVYGGYDILFLAQPFNDYAAEYGFKTAHNWYLLDHVLQMAPWQHQVRKSFAQHEWPLWNPTMLSGDILAAGMQAAPYNPLNLVAMLLPPDLAPTFDAAMVFFLAALLTYAFARELECSEGAALIAAAGFTLSSAMAFYVGWPHCRSWTVLPFVLLSVRRVIRARDVAAFSLLTIALVVLIVFGHPETMLHVVTIGAVYGIFELLPAGRGRMRAVAIAVAAGGVALLVTAIFVLPFLSLFRSAWEYRMRLLLLQTPSSVTAHEVWRAVRATFLPYYGGSSWHTLTSEWEFGTARVGSVILALAAIASLRLWRRREVRFLIVLGIITLLASWSAPPVATALRALPLFNVALNGRLGFAAALSLSLLAAMAFDAFAAIRRDRRIALAVSLVVGAALAIATASFWRMQVSIGVDRKLLIAGAAAELIGMVMLLAALGTPSRRVALALILAAIAGQRIAEDGNIYPTLPRRMFYPSVPLVAAIPRDPLFRVVGTGSILIPNVAAMYGLEDIRGGAAMTYTPYMETMPLWAPTAKRTYHDVTDLSLPFLSFLGVRHAITPRTMDPPPGWRVIADDRASRLMENPKAIPRVFVPRRIRFIDNDKTTLEEMALATDFSDTAWIEAHDMPPHVIDNGEAVLHLRRVKSRYEINADARSACRIVITEASWPGWRTYIDGRRVKMERANHAFLSVYVPAGRHHLRVVYLPDPFVQGRAISLGTLVLLGVGIGIRRVLRAIK